MTVSELFNADAWQQVPGFAFTDITYHRAVDCGVVRIAFDRPEIRNAFRPHTVDELFLALDHARCTSDVGCVLLTGNGPSPRDGGWAFCSGGDVKDIIGELFARDMEGLLEFTRMTCELVRQIRTLPKPVIDLANVVSKFLAMGMPLMDGLACVTSNAARSIKEFNALGTLRTGSIADVTLLDLAQGNFDFVDNYKGKRSGTQRLSAKAVVVGGKQLV